MPKTAQAIPKGYHTVTPSLMVAGAAEAIDFYKKAFGATEVMRFPGPDGKLMHAEIRIGDSTIMLGDEMPEHGAKGPKSYGGTSTSFFIYGDDVDAAWKRAVDAGAKPTMPL
ncbi:MAG: VOC family protein, partial [Gemmatimonadales bacterium]|nr:VOC family protein [Gemmatimonadales bacterium]